MSKPVKNPMLVFDVESMGLHGVGFAVGAVVVDVDGKVLEEFYDACDPRPLEPIARPEDVLWLRTNCYPALMPPTVATPRAVRDAFWAFWRTWADKGAELWADCGWPVEARFLAACVDDDTSRWWMGPYPFHEVAEHVGTGTHPRLPNELPIHNPLNDARQSARLLVEALRMREALVSLGMSHGYFGDLS